jgi:hypothetical protein
VREVTATLPPTRSRFAAWRPGPFDPAIWEAGKLHFLPDARSPLLEPRSGKFRNIYAPSIVQTKDGWGNLLRRLGRRTHRQRPHLPRHDARLPDLLATAKSIVEHGDFRHVCNVSATRLPAGSLAMMCTAYPDAKGLNKPASFLDPDAEAPHVAKREDVITIDGYPAYGGADINGMNVLLHEDGRFRLYFCNFNDGGRSSAPAVTMGRVTTSKASCCPRRRGS